MSFLRRLFGGATAPKPALEVGGKDADASDVGIFAGLFVASLEDVQRWGARTGLTPPEWPAVRFKRLDTVKVGTLESLVTGVPYEAIDQGQLHNLVCQGGEEGPWISRLRQPLVDALSGLDPAHVPGIAASWADTDEFKIRPSDRPSPDLIGYLAEAIEDIAALARTSRARGEPMFLMMGL